MNQFDKNQIITLDIQDPQQIKLALTQYKALLDEDRAFSDSQFDVEFKQLGKDGKRRLQPQDSGNNLKLLQSALNLGQEGGSHHYNHPIDDDTETYISEVILFAAALQYPEIKEVVVETAEAIVAYSRRQNDTDEMWLDDMRVFGVEALYMLAKTDIRYTFLLAQFFVPYWDDEHACGYESYLSSLLHEHGWHKEIIKAFIWCDNESFRSGMFQNDRYSDDCSYQPLGEYLCQHPEHYEQFKALVVARFQAEPVLLEHVDTMCDEDEEEDLSTYQPVVSLYQSLFPHTCFYDDEEAKDSFMAMPFFGSTLENEAYDLQQKVQSQVVGPLVKIAQSAITARANYRAYLARDERKYELNYGSNLLKPLVLAMPQGESLWRYIESGEPHTVLETLCEVDVLELAKLHASDMAEHLIDQLSSFERNNQGIADELESVLSLVRGDLLTEHFSEEVEYTQPNGMVLTLTVRKDTETSLLQARAQQYLRVIDVFYYALGKREFSKYMMTSLTEGDEALLSREAYYQRYTQLSLSDIESAAESAKAKNIQSIFHHFTNQDELLCRKHLKLVDEHFRSSRALCHPEQWPQSDMGLMTLASYHLHCDYNQRIGDDITEALVTYLNDNHIWQLAAQHIIQKCHKKSDHYNPENLGLSEEQIARICDHFTADTPRDDLVSILALVQPHLYRDECCRGDLYLNKFSEQQPSYQLFKDHDDDFQRFTLAAFWLRQLPLPLQNKADRLWQFIIALAPVRVARNVLRAYSDDHWDIEFNNILDGIDVYEHLSKAGIDSGILNAYEMSYQRYDFGRYVNWIEIYSEIVSDDTSMFGSMGRKKAKAMERGLAYINERTKVEFLHHVSLKHPEVAVDFDHNLRRAIDIFAQLNLHSWEHALAHESGKDCLYFGEGEKLPKKLHKAIVADSLSIHDKPCHVDGRSWEACTVLQQQGDNYVIVMADHEVPLAWYEDRLSSGPLLVFSEQVERAAIVKRVAELQVQSNRINGIVEQTMAYLDNEIEFDAMAALFKEQISTEFMRIDADEYHMYSLRQFVWMLDVKRRNKLVRLLLNHDYRGFKLIEAQMEQPWLLHQLAHNEIDFETYLSNSDEYEGEASETGMAFLLAWLFDIGVKSEHLMLFCIKRSHFDVCREFIVAHARGQYGSFKQSLSYLHAGRRAELPEILSQEADAEVLLAPLKKDKSRKVKEAVSHYCS
ncbi:MULTISPECIES: hypothetical protein [Pseudoalteromonas]|uniref:hypothetical protein n=1 Tax=Pseudoalteromonas TaxID=53246 RepID=UPI000FFEC895|nr:hypothetical protein [Pseudoalteromonas sp. A757]RXE86175.1 hypothetical protein DRB05_12175 [Pseudoalteromonas sp. A757]